METPTSASSRRASYGSSSKATATEPVKYALFPISMAHGATSCSPDFSSACRGHEDPSLRWSTFFRESRPVSEGTSFFLRRNSKPPTSSEKLS